MLEELCKRIQHCCATLRRSRNKRNVGSCWLKSLTGFKLCATTSNNMQQGVQTDETCNILQCWDLLANNVASVCTQPREHPFLRNLSDGEKNVPGFFLGKINSSRKQTRGFRKFFAHAVLNGSPSVTACKHVILFNKAIPRCRGSNRSVIDHR